MRILLLHKIGFGLLGVGVLLLVYPITFLSYFTYPVLAWGALAVIDALNVKRWKTSPITENVLLFWGIIVPVSVLFWLFFEYLNLLYPQWHYLNTPPNRGIGTILAFLSFATVIPLVIEVLWYISAEVKSFYSSKNMLSFITHHRWLFPFFAILLLSSFFFEITLWSIQVMWFIPFLLFLPFVPVTPVPPSKFRNFITSAFGAALLSGIIWETVNYWAETKWDYLLLPDTLHLFEMPIAGYLGYIPFTFSLLAVYLWTKRNIRFTLRNAGILYLFALVTPYVFLVLYSATCQP